MAQVAHRYTVCKRISNSSAAGGSRVSARRSAKRDAQYPMKATAPAELKKSQYHAKAPPNAGI